MAKNAHLTFDERQTIEVSLRDNLKFKEIGEIIRKDPSTISKEVRNHYKIVEKVLTTHVPTDIYVSITVTSANPVRNAGDKIVRNVIHLAILTVLILRNRFA